MAIDRQRCRLRWSQAEAPDPKIGLGVVRIERVVVAVTVDGSTRRLAPFQRSQSVRRRCHASLLEALCGFMQGDRFASLQEEHDQEAVEVGLRVVLGCLQLRNPDPERVAVWIRPLAPKPPPGCSLLVHPVLSPATEPSAIRRPAGPHRCNSASQSGRRHSAGSAPATLVAPRSRLVVLAVKLYRCASVDQPAVVAGVAPPARTGGSIGSTGLTRIRTSTTLVSGAHAALSSTDCNATRRR